MGIDGLDFILNKQEVVPTVSASDLLLHPERVETDYLRHVRTYVPISRVADGQDDILSVVEFERRVIRAVKGARAPRGYLTAEYGYGKTSSSLYLWQKAEESNLIAVPPFQMLNLSDLVTATHGWLRYRIQVKQPSLLPDLEHIYSDAIGRSLEKEAQTSGVELSTLQRWANTGRFIVDLQPVDYITYFEKATEIALKANYDGILILPDEIQQYIEPQVQRSDDPIGPLFNLVQMLATRDRYLRFGMIMVIPLKEIGVIRNARGRDDLLQRMRELSLDLTSVYDQSFATNLWNLLAQEFGFKELQSQIVMAETLTALGEISARDDLSNGPRTVVNVFRRIVERYRSFISTPSPYSPIDLVDDLIAGAIPFSGNNQIQNVTRRALQNAIVQRETKRFEPAVKIAAAYPTAGVPIRVQNQFGVADALDDLMRQALGELVISVGPLDLHGVTLFGLQIGVQQTDWLSQTIREFRRSYGEHQKDTRSRAVAVFSLLLKKRVFNGWNIQDERSASLTSNETIVFEGDFPSFASRFPKRRIHVRILWEGEERKDADIDGDVAVEFRLSLHSELREKVDDRRSLAQELQFDFDGYTAVIPINLMYVRPEGIPKQIQQKLQDVWSPYDLSPLVLMNIYQMLEEKRERNLIPRSDDGIIVSGFQPELLDSILRDLLNAEVGAALGGVSQARIAEKAVEELLDNRYGRAYHTIMATTTWKNSLQRYSNALSMLGNPYQQRGEVEVEGSKKQIAEMFSYSNSALDSFIKSFPELLVVTRNWKGDESGAVKFVLHDLETHILRWLRESEKTERVSVGGSTKEIHSIDLSEVFRRAQALGYRSDEIDELIKLLGRRNVAVIYQTYQLREVPSQTVDLDSVRYQIEQFSLDLRTLRDGFPDNSTLAGLQQQIERWEQIVSQQATSGKPDPQLVYQVGRAIQARQEEVGRFRSDKQQELLRQLAAVRRGFQQINQSQLTALENQILSSVGYVDQVNAIRRAVLNNAHGVKAEYDKLNSKLEHVQNALSRTDVTYQSLARAANELDNVEAALGKAKEQKDKFDTNYRYLDGWRAVVSDGATLSDLLQQISRLAQPEIRQYEDISREISGRISSATNKIDVLPDYALYSDRIQALLQRARALRDDAENAYVDLQNRYMRSLTESNLYTRERLGRPLAYNVVNAEESYRLLYENVRDLIAELLQQLLKVFRDHETEAKNILRTPLIQNLLTEEREGIERLGAEIIRQANEGTTLLISMQETAFELETIRDFPIDTQGKYEQIITSLSSARDVARQLALKIREIGSWLTQVALSDEEQILIDNFPVAEPDAQVDLVDWISRTKFTPDDFWRALRSLNEKRWIKISVSRVRR